MLIANIIIDLDILIKINEFKINDIFLINIYNDGICISQNINDLSNLSIFISKDKLNVFEVNQECSFVTDDILNIKNVKITKLYNKFLINNSLSIVNSCCNICKEFKNLKFKNVNNLNFNLDNKLNFFTNYTFATSNNFNGVVLMKKIDFLIMYVNQLYNE
tara:strand:- start:305 stop:787 length:483 start_codon:yes stop_codon:yes gene_type:complete